MGNDDSDTMEFLMTERFIEKRLKTLVPASVPDPASGRKVRDPIPGKSFEKRRIINGRIYWESEGLGHREKD